MRRINTLILSILILIGLTSCSTVAQSIELAVCGSYGVPGMICFDLKGGSFVCEIMETDSFGRILFTYSAYNCIEQQNVTFYVICQHIDSKNVFFYEDMCFIRYTEDSELLESFKTNNDWESELKFEKMSTRPKSISSDLVLQTNVQTDINAVKSIFCKATGLETTAIVDSMLIDANAEGQTLYVFDVTESNSIQKYLVLSDLEYQVCWMVLDTDSEYMDDLVSFKHLIGWSYPEA